MPHQAVPICKQVSWQAPSKSRDGKTISVCMDGSCLFSGSFARVCETTDPCAGQQLCSRDILQPCASTYSTPLRSLPFHCVSLFMWRACFEGTGTLGLKVKADSVCNMGWACILTVQQCQDNTSCSPTPLSQGGRNRGRSRWWGCSISQSLSIKTLTATFKIFMTT